MLYWHRVRYVERWIGVHRVSDETFSKFVAKSMHIHSHILTVKKITSNTAMSVLILGVQIGSVVLKSRLAISIYIKTQKQFHF